MPNSQAVFEVLGPRLKAGMFHVTSPRGARGILADGAIKPNLNYRFGKTFLQPFGVPPDIVHGWVCLFDWRDHPDLVILSTDRWSFKPAMYLGMHDPISVIFRIKRGALTGCLLPNKYINGIEVWCTVEIPLKAVQDVLVYNIYMPADCEVLDPNDRAGIEAALTRLDEEAQRISPIYRANVAFDRAQAAMKAEAVQEVALLAAVDKALAGHVVHPAVRRAWEFFKAEYHPFACRHRYRLRDVPLTLPGSAAPLDPAQLARAQDLAAECGQIEGIFLAGGDLVVAYDGDDALFEGTVAGKLGFVWFLRMRGDIGCTYDPAYESKWLSASLHEWRKTGIRWLINRPEEWSGVLAGSWPEEITCFNRRWPFLDIGQMYLDLCCR